MRPGLFTVALLCALAAAWPTTAQDRTFGGYECTEDCSGHKAGYEWAERQGISDSNECGGNSQSFIEGCMVFTQDPSRAASEDDDGKEIDE